MITISRRFTFEAAHRLEHHEGKCSRLHGHSYKLEVEVGRDNLLIIGPEHGMVMDFARLEKIVNTTVVERLDHSFLRTDETPQALVAVLRIEEVYPLSIKASTAELIVEWCAGQIKPFLPEGVVLTRLRLWETEKAYAEWRI